MITDLNSRLQRLPEAHRAVLASILPSTANSYEQCIIFGDVAVRRFVQDEQFGVNHWSWTGWLALAQEEIGEATRHAIRLDFNPKFSSEEREFERTRLRTELIDAISVLVAMVEDLDMEAVHVGLEQSPEAVGGSPEPQHADE